MDRIKWNDNKDKSGIEGWYSACKKRNLLIIYLEPSNHLENWRKNFTAGREDYAGQKCHKGYIPYVGWLRRFIVRRIIQEQLYDGVKVILIGYSMGGGVAQLTALGSIFQTRVYNIGGPRVCSRPPEGLTYKMRGDIVPGIPFWFRKMRVKKLGERWRPFWKAHAEYDVNGLIEEIIEEESYGTI